VIHHVNLSKRRLQLSKPAIMSETSQNDPMTEPQQHFYQAIATIEGILTLDGSNSSLSAGGSDFPVIVAKKVRQRHKPGEVQCFFVYPMYKRGQPAFKINNIVARAPEPIIIKGCWELNNNSPCMVVYRNELIHEHDKNLKYIFPVVWENAPDADGQFWELEVEVRDGAFTVTCAEGLYDPPPKATEFMLPQPKAPKDPPQSVAKPQPSAPTSIKPLTPQEIRAMATPAKIQVTCKLNEVPKHRDLVDKRVEFFLKDGESERIFTVHMKPKIFKKLTEHGFTEWVAAITGEIGPGTETGFELVNAAVQVFAKKAREADAVPNEKAGDGNEKGEGVGKRKSLLDGVKMR
jgi:hypothetical protein